MTNNLTRKSCEQASWKNKQKGLLDIFNFDILVLYEIENNGFTCAGGPSKI